mmetsp:Transcript_12669/g.19270  ORF Transcript_12669/g.19270 Transcript_12669/m.19270 type:complete len:248 (-) Transcript_12669:95-838(-)
MEVTRDEESPDFGTSTYPPSNFTQEHVGSLVQQQQEQQLTQQQYYHDQKDRACFTSLSQRRSPSSASGSLDTEGELPPSLRTKPTLPYRMMFAVVCLTAFIAICDSKELRYPHHNHFAFSVEHSRELVFPPTEDEEAFAAALPTVSLREELGSKQKHPGMSMARGDVHETISYGEEPTLDRFLYDPKKFDSTQIRRNPHSSSFVGWWTASFALLCFMTLATSNFAVKVGRTCQRQLRLEGQRGVRFA